MPIKRDGNPGGQMIPGGLRGLAKPYAQKLQPERISSLDWFMLIAHVVSMRSTCTRRKVGAIAVKDGLIIAEGYNGVLRDHEHCTPETCLRTINNIPSGKSLDICKAMHAEQNIIANSSRLGFSLAGTDVYCTTMPCPICLKMLCASGVANVYFTGSYSKGNMESVYGQISELEQMTLVEVAGFDPKEIFTKYI